MAELLSWFDVATAERPTVFGLYFEDVDHAGHDFGPSSQELKQAVSAVDSAIGELLQGLEERGIAGKVNIIVVADHGMSQLSRERVVFLDDYIGADHMDMTYSGPVTSFYIRDAEPGSAIASLKKVPHARFYSGDTAPSRFHYAGSARLTPYFLLADDGWSLTTHEYFNSHPKYATGGAHGYDPELPSMRALFIANGPAFVPGSTLPPFQNIDLYDLFAHLQGLTPAKNDGDPATFRSVLKEGGKVKKAVAGK